MYAATQSLAFNLLVLTFGNYQIIIRMRFSGNYQILVFVATQVKS
jgi:hypothetical protein